MSTPVADRRGNKRNTGLSGAGLVLLDSLGTTIYFNADAIQILTFPQTPPDANPSGKLLAREIRSRLLTDAPSPESPFVKELVSGKRRYVCRAFPLISAPRNTFHATTALLIERGVPRTINVSEMAAQFRLTRREREAVELLMLGLTSKEIASRMKISTNTVKAFLRLVMSKMAVSTRSGIVGKIIRT